MTNKATKYGIMIIVAVLLVAMAFAGAVSATTVYAGTLTAVQTAINTGNDVQLTNQITLGSGSYSLDLKGHTVTAKENTRLFYISDGGSFTLSDSVGGGKLVGNGIVSGDGGGVYIYWGSFTMSGGTISNCSSSNYGGGVYNWDRFTMSGGTISNCIATQRGGGVYIKNDDGTTFTMKGGNITGCTAQNGGGVYVYSGTFNMYGGNITNCSASKYGGGVYNWDSFTMSGGTISDCTVIYDGTDAGDGGGVYNNEDFTMSGGTISNCIATQRGGGVAVNSNTDTFTMSGGTISDCTAFDSGAIHCQGIVRISGTARIENCTAKDTSVTEGGGAIQIPADGKLYVTGGTFRNNSAVSNGGAILVMNGMAWISGGVFENNQAACGGAIVFGGSTSNYDSALTGGIFHGNKDDDGSNAIVTDCIDSRSAQIIIGGNFHLEDNQSFKVNAIKSGYPIRIGTPVNLPASPVVYTSGMFTGYINNIIIDNENLDGCTLFEIKVDGQTATDVLGRIGLNDTVKWTLVANDSLKTITCKLKPVVSSASVIFGNENTTAYVNITLTNNTGAGTAVVEFWNASGKISSSNVITTGLTKGSTVGGFVVNGLVENYEYTVTANLTMVDSAVLYANYTLGTFSCNNPKITPQNAAYKLGETAEKLRVTVDAVNPIYQWENSTDGKTFSEMSGETFDNITPSTAAIGTVYYRVIVTAGEKRFYSPVAAVEVYETYTISYDMALGGTNPSENPSFYSNNATVYLKDPEKSYYVGYWNNTATSSVVSVIYKGTTGDLNLKAEYTPKEYNISYVDGGTHTNPTSYNITSGTISLHDATKDGYMFLGWYENADFSGTKVTLISASAPKEITLYAQWVQQVTKDVDSTGKTTFDDNEGDVTPRVAGTQTMISEISGLENGNTVGFAKGRDDISASDLPAKSGYYTTLYSAFDINYTGELPNNEAQITIKVTVANGDSASSLRALHQNSSGWEDLRDVSKTQSGNVVTIVGNVTSFSPFAIVSYSAQPQPTYSSSSNKQTGYTQILLEGQVAPTPYPTVAPTGDSIEEFDDLAEPTPATPTSVATAKPTTQPTQSSPAPVAGIITGLGAAALFIKRLRK